MISVKGKYAEAQIMCAEEPEQYATSQIKMICDNEASQGAVIRIMPDVHPGKVGPVGLTMTVTDRILPALVGVDIGCGILAICVGKIKNDFQRLDSVIRNAIPTGFQTRKKIHHTADQSKLDGLCCANHIRKQKALLSLGTLGGGNHFIELDQDETGVTYLIIHTGSRHLGKEVADYYMSAGQRKLKDKRFDVPYEMTWIEEDLMEDYLHDLAIVQDYASLNRYIIATEIMKGMKWKRQSEMSCIHNYVDLTTDVPILRKGAISAKPDEDVIIPINMKDGVIIGRGKGNAEWNYSAPHGGGRVLSREAVQTSHTVSEFKAEMKGIYSSCIGKGTLDEAPFAYRRKEYVEDAVKDTVTVEKVLSPVYNFKGGEER